jgi:hypothetical protein
MGDISKRVATYSSPPKKKSLSVSATEKQMHRTMYAAFNGIFLHMYRKVPESFWKAASTGANMVCAASTSSLLMQIHVAQVWYFSSVANSLQNFSTRPRIREVGYEMIYWPVVYIIL